MFVKIVYYEICNCGSIAWHTENAPVHGNNVAGINCQKESRHSGRIFSSAGVIIYDLLALILGSLATSGLVLWFRSL